ncbi:MAG: type II secretion system F family protein [Clostridia bacterium]|nr:type II secretion system F family protein [Clostridia bacterium]
MQKYKYTAVNLAKEKFSGIFIAQDEHDLAVQLSKQNLYLISYKIYKGTTPSSFFTLGTGKLTTADLTTFCRQYAIMINSGMSLMEGIDVLKAQPYSAFLKSILEVVSEDVKAGMMLSEAFNKHDSAFPDFFRSMVYVGEVSGKLDMVFNSLADYYENDAKIKKKTKSAMAYPTMLAAMTLGILIAMLVFIVPTFRSSLSSLDIEAEGITKAVYDISDFVLANWLYILFVIVAIGLVLFVFLKTEKGKYAFDVFKLKAPILGTVTIDLITARFARGFSLLLSSGMDIADAMESIQVVLGNRDVTKRFKRATEEVMQGSSLAVALQKYKIFPDMMIQMIAVGEKTASIDDVLTRSCSFFDEKVETTLSSATSKIQPIMLMLMGGIVGVLFIAIYSPMLSIMTSIT